MADPIVVSQLIAKRSELAGLIDAKRGELNSILKDLAHIDGSIKIFAPERVPELLPVKRRTQRSHIRPAWADAADIRDTAGIGQVYDGARDHRQDRPGQGNRCGASAAQRARRAGLEAAGEGAGEQD